LAEGVKPPRRDPIRAYARKTTAARLVGEGNKCTCGEDRPEAIVPGSNPTECYRCERIRCGKATEDGHHVAGKANHPAKIPTPVNDHRARLSIDQYDWPKGTLENPNGSPLLAAAACIRGIINYLYYLIETYLAWIPEMLEALDTFLVTKLGTKWWHNTPLERFAPKPKRDATA
jgi:hypothetical protein